MTQRTALITGGAGAGIGRALSAAVAADGWTVVIGDRDLDAAERIAAELRDRGRRCAALVLDVADEASVERAFAEIEASHPPLGGLVNNAGIGLIKPLAQVSASEWDRLLGVDLRGSFLCARAAIPLLSRAGGGAIVNIGSVQAVGPHVGYSAYAAAKAGLVGLTRGIAADHGRDGIRCSIVHPGFVDSPQNRELFAEWGDADAWIADYVQTRQMIPRTISGEEIGATVAFLLSDDARSITAAEITIDGGSSRMAFDNTSDERGV